MFHAAFAVDARAIGDLEVALSSLAVHQRDVHATVLGFDLTRESRSRIDRIAGLAGINLHVTALPTEHPVRALATNERLSSATYGKLIMPDVVAAEHYVGLDADVLIVGRVGELRRQPADRRPFAAVADAYLGMLRRRPRRTRRVVTARPAFNAGVLVVDGMQWRSRGITEATLARAGGTVGPQLDQDALNWVAGGGYARLPARFNLQTFHVERARRCWAPLIARELADARVFHFSGPFGVSRPGPWCSAQTLQPVTDAARHGDLDGLREAIEATKSAVIASIR